MKKIELNHWFVGDNELGISLMRYFVKVSICKNDNFIYYPLEVYQDSKSILRFNFYSIGDAISFTENEIKKSETKEEILKNYEEKYLNEELKPIPTKPKIYKKTK